ncbi:hypothetical protein ACPBEI_03765 [Latilactobacillus sakei]
MMIKLYRGAIPSEHDNQLVFENDPEQIIKTYKKIITKYASTLPSPKIYVQYLEMRYYFEVDITGHARVPVRRIVRLLKSAFPQFIWTRVVEHADNRYRLEFVPVSWSYSDSVDAEQVLTAAIAEMGYGQNELYESIKQQMATLFFELFDFEQAVMRQKPQQEIVVPKKVSNLKKQPDEIVEKSSPEITDPEAELQAKIEDLLAKLYENKASAKDEMADAEAKVVPIRTTRHKPQRVERTMSNPKVPVATDSAGTLLAKIKKKIAPITKR